MTCYACNESGHLIQQCPSRQRNMRQVDVNRTTTWATLIEQEEDSLQAQSSRAHDTGKRIRDLFDKEKQARDRKEEIEMTGLPAKLDNEVTVQKTQESRGDREQSSQPAGMEGTEQKDVDGRTTEQLVEEGRSKGEKGAQGLGFWKSAATHPGTSGGEICGRHNNRSNTTSGKPGRVPTFSGIRRGGKSVVAGYASKQKAKDRRTSYE